MLNQFFINRHHCRESNPPSPDDNFYAIVSRSRSQTSVVNQEEKSPDDEHNSDDFDAIVSRSSPPSRMFPVLGAFDAMLLVFFTQDKGLGPDVAKKILSL